MLFVYFFGCFFNRKNNRLKRLKKDGETQKNRIKPIDKCSLVC